MSAHVWHITYHFIWFLRLLSRLWCFETLRKFVRWICCTTCMLRSMSVTKQDLFFKYYCVFEPWTVGSSAWQLRTSATGSGNARVLELKCQSDFCELHNWSSAKLFVFLETRAPEDMNGHDPDHLCDMECKTWNLVAIQVQKHVAPCLATGFNLVTQGWEKLLSKISDSNSKWLVWMGPIGRIYSAGRTLWARQCGSIALAHLV